MTNTSATSSSRSTAASPRDGDRPGAAPDARSAADFERALRRHAALQDKGRQRGRDTEAEEPPGDALQATPAPGLPAAFALSLAPLKAPVEATPCARGLVEPPPAARLSELTPLATPGNTGADAARAFEVSLPQQLAGGLTLHAVAPAPGACWALSIGAHGLNPQELRRNLGRLEQRLRAKAVPLDAVQLHHHHPDPDQDSP